MLRLSIPIVILSLLLLVSFVKKENSQEKVVFNDAKMIDTACRDRIENNSRWFLCYREKFAALTKTQSLPYVLKVLDALQTINTKTKECHLIAHQIAQSEVEKNPNNWKSLVGIVSENYCDYGFMHGALEGRMRFDPSFSIHENTIAQVCADVEKTNKIPFGYSLCSHAMGHILLAQENGNIPSALAVCQKTPQKAQFNCFAGVFMEDFTRFNLAAHTEVAPITWDEETARFYENRCQTYQGVQATACWLEMAHFYVEFAPNSPDEVFARCNQAPAKEYRTACYRHAIGKLFVINYKADNAFLATICKPYENDHEEYKICVGEGVGAMVNNTLDSVERTIVYCKSVQGEFMDVCYESLGDFLQALVTKEQQKKLCQSVPKQYQNLCLDRSRIAQNAAEEIFSVWHEGVSLINSSLGGPEKEASNIYKICAGAKTDSRECYENGLEHVTKTRTLKYATETLFALQKLDPKHTAECHRIAHAISSTETAKNPDNWLEIFSQVNPNVCGRGFYHGIIEARQHYDPNFVLNEKTIPQMCGEIAKHSTLRIKGEPLEEGVCGHEFGHLLLVQEEGNIEKAVAMCYKMPAAMAAECFRGVFMEETDRDNLIAHGIKEKLIWNNDSAEHVTKTCLSYSDLAASGCWRAVSHVFASISKGDPKKIYEQCQRALESHDKERCYNRGAGYMAIEAAHNGMPPNEVSVLCEPYAQEKTKRTGCINMIVLYVIDASPLFTPWVTAFCDSAKEDSRFCYESLAIYLGNFATEEQQEALCVNPNAATATVCAKLKENSNLLRHIVSLWQDGFHSTLLVITSPFSFKR